MGVLRWSPRSFWTATMWDIAQAIEGYRIANGGKDRKKPILDGNEIQQLKKMALDEKRRDLGRVGHVGKSV